jgi:hypothetical protein
MCDFCKSIIFMKHVLIIGGDKALASVAAVSCLQQYKRCEAYFYVLPAVSIELNAEESELMASVSLPLTNDIAFFNSIYYQADYIICVQKDMLWQAESFSSQGLVFDYHFDFNGDKRETLLAMKQYFERFCKMYLNEFI